MKLIFLFFFLCSGSWAQDQLHLKVEDMGEVLFLRVEIKKSSSTLINDQADERYVWNEDEEGRRYYMVGVPEVRENLWLGVGHAENLEQDYLALGVRNLGAQFGQSFPKNAVEHFSFNGRFNPGSVEDQGFGMYPERTVQVKNIKGVRAVRAWASFFELGSNNLILQVILDNNAFLLKEFSEKNFVLLGDGLLEIKLPRR